MKPTLDLLDKNQICDHISPANLSMIHQFILKPTLPSTNTFLMHHAKTTNFENVVCLAEQQTAGRGRLGRQWVSPYAENIYLSLLWHFSCSPAELSGLNILVGVSAAEAIQLVADNKNIQLKWPNDIYLNDAKAGGILIEILAGPDDTSKAVIGIGLNIAMSETHTADIQKPWINLSTDTKSFSRNLIAGVMIDKLISNLLLYTNTGIEPFLKTWMQLDYLYGKLISITTPQQIITGIAQGVNHQGQLLLQTGTGNTLPISTGEASVSFPQPMP